jgi:hypothetical protein
MIEFPDGVRSIRKLAVYSIDPLREEGIEVSGVVIVAGNCCCGDLCL